MRADDQTRPHDERARIEDLADGLLAKRLQRPIALVGHLVVRQLAELADRALLVVREREVRIDGDARDEAVEAATRGERTRGGAHDARQVPAGVDDGIPLATLETREVAGAVADDPLDVGVELRVRGAAVEERELVTALERSVRDGAAEEPRPAQEQELHASSESPPSRRSTSSSVL